MSAREQGAAGRAVTRRFTRADAALVAGGAALTALLAAAAARKPLPALGLLAVLAVLAIVLVARPRLARLRVSSVLVAGLVVLPAAALLGPSFAVPAFPQLFLFRLVLAGIIALGVTYLVVRRQPLAFAAQDVALPIVLWFAWLFIGLAWSADKPGALNYLAIVVTMMALMLATAAAGGTRRRLIWLGYLLILAYLFVAGFSMLEARFGVRLPTSRLITAVTSQTYAVTSVFVNQNDLATYLAFCWPFMLCAFFFTRRLRWLALDVLLILLGATAFVRTGSRSSLVAAGISTLAAVVLFWHLSARVSARTGKVVTAVVAIVLVVAPAICSSTTRRATCCASSAWSRCSARRRPARGPVTSAPTSRAAASRSPATPCCSAPAPGRRRASSRPAPTRSASPTCTTGGWRRTQTAGSSASPCTSSSSCSWWWGCGR